MNILYVGDVMAEPGLEIVEKVLPKLRRDLEIDCVIAQAENLSQGRGVSLTDFRRLQKTGVDFCTGGNHSFDREEIFPLLNDPDEPIIRPANYAPGTPGLGAKYIATGRGKLLVVSLLGQTVGKSGDYPVDNPLKVIDAILSAEPAEKRIGCVVNFHGDFSSEKVVIGHYLDGRVTAVIGDHWHVPTADARVLPGGTAHMSDVGMCGVLNSSLGVKYDVIVSRWRDGMKNRNILELSGAKQFNAVLIRFNPESRRAEAIIPVQQIFPE